MSDIASRDGGPRAGAGLKLVLFSLIGIVLFFVPALLSLLESFHAWTAAPTAPRPA